MYLRRSSKCKILVLYPSFLTSIIKGGGTNLYTEQLVFSEGFFPNPYIVFQFPKPIYWIYKVFKKSSFWRWLVLTLQMFLWALALIITPNCTSRELTRYLLKILFTLSNKFIIKFIQKLYSFYSNDNQATALQPKPWKNKKKLPDQGHPAPVRYVSQRVIPPIHVSSNLSRVCQRWTIPLHHHFQIQTRTGVFS